MQASKTTVPSGGAKSRWNNWLQFQEAVAQTNRVVAQWLGGTDSAGQQRLLSSRNGLNETSENALTRCCR